MYIITIYFITAAKYVAAISIIAAKLTKLFNKKVTENRYNSIFLCYCTLTQPCETAFTTRSIAFFAPNLLNSFLRKVSTVFSEIPNK